MGEGILVMVVVVVVVVLVGGVNDKILGSLMVLLVRGRQIRCEGVFL